MRIADLRRLMRDHLSFWSSQATLTKRIRHLESLTIVLTNDADHSNARRDRIIYESLTEIGARFTSAVFCRVVEDQSTLGLHCRPSDTDSLESPDYLRLMQDLVDAGNEVAYHGFSQVTNTRQEFLAGLTRLSDLFGEVKTYIEHGGNPRSHPREACKQESLDMSGARAESPYFVLDIIKERKLVTWAHHALDDSLMSMGRIEKTFLMDEGVKKFLRHRFHQLPLAISAWNEPNPMFMAYTHFGYQYPGFSPYSLDRLGSPEGLARAISFLTYLSENVDLRWLTVSEAASQQPQELSP